MDATTLAEVADRFGAFHQRFAPLFGRIEAQTRSAQYLQGLLVQQTDRRNAENLAEAVPGATPRTLQRLLTEAPWAHERVIEALQAWLAERLNTPDGVFIVDETGFPKQGAKSVGVARQYCGTLGKVGNCQLGVFVAYASTRGSALVDGQLYLPTAWTDHPVRCAAAGVPSGVAYQSLPEIGLALLRQTRTRRHLTGPWVTADEGYGKSPTFRDGLAAAGWWYVLEVPQTTPVFAKPAATVVPPWSGHGRKPTKARLAPAAAAAISVAAMAAALPDAAWTEVTVAEGEQGPRRAQVAACRVWEAREGVPGRACWLVLRRNRDGQDPKAYLSNAPEETSVLTLAQVGAMRWPIETAFQQAKGEAGLDEYEVRGWMGWSHHITLVLLAMAFLLDIQQVWKKKPAPADDSPGQSAVAGLVAATALDQGGVVGLADPNPGADRGGESLPRQTPPRRAA
jgi:SRSO17 transposase